MKLNSYFSFAIWMAWHKSKISVSFFAIYLLRQYADFYFKQRGVYIYYILMSQIITL